jgi:putative DNA primase/helicase
MSELEAQPNTAPDVIDLTTRERVGLTSTEAGNAEAFARLNHSNVRYCMDDGDWLAWGRSGTHWVKGREAELEVQNLVIAFSAEHLPRTTDADLRHQQKALSKAGVKSTIELARSHPLIRVSLDDLDKNPYDLNTPGGIVDLRRDAP